MRASCHEGICVWGGKAVVYQGKYKIIRFSGAEVPILQRKMPDSGEKTKETMKITQKCPLSVYMAGVPWKTREKENAKKNRKSTENVRKQLETRLEQARKSWRNTWRNWWEKIAGEKAGTDTVPEFRRILRAHEKWGLLLPAVTENLSSKEDRK